MRVLEKIANKYIGTRQRYRFFLKIQDLENPISSRRRTARSAFSDERNSRNVSQEKIWLIHVNARI